MKPRNTRLDLLALVFVLVLVVGTVGLYYLVPGSGPPGSLPIPAGTVFSGNDIRSWFAHFDAPDYATRIVGSWTAVDGMGWPQLVVVNGTVARPSDAVYHCPLLHPWDRSNGTIDVPVGPGPHTLYWSFCFSASRITITEPIRTTAFGLGG